MKNTLLFASLFLFSVYIIVLLFLYFYQERMIFYPERLKADYTFSFEKPFQEYHIPTADGYQLNALHFKAQAPKGVVFYLHGNAGSLRNWGEIADIYTQHHYDFFIFDYRGFGKSEGRISSQQQLFEDNQLLYDFLCQKFPEKQIVLVGYSIGSGMAAKLAADNQAGKLILKAPYFSLQQVMKRHFPWVPGFLLRYPLPTHDFLANTTVPITLFHGTADETIPYENAVKLKEQQADKIRLFPLKNQGHNGLNEHPLFRKKLAEILASNP